MVILIKDEFIFSQKVYNERNLVYFSKNATFITFKRGFISMKFIGFVAVLILNCISLYSQNQIPDRITTDLVLKPMAKPYESDGFIVEEGATLTILPGTKVKFNGKKDPKENVSVTIQGKLVIGAKGNAKSAPVEFTGVSPWYYFKSANLEINGWNVTAARFQFHGDNNGTIRNVNFLRNPRGIAYTFNLTVPKNGNLTITDCLIEDQGLDINTTDFPNDLDRLTLTKVAFTTNVHTNGKKLNKHYLPITTFAYGTQCDCYIDITFKAFNWDLKKGLKTEWFIANEVSRKTTEESAKPLKSFAIKLPSKAFTSFKQVEDPELNVEKKK